MEQELKAIASANPAAQPWIVLWMAGDPAPGERGLIRDRCRHDAYLGLVLGGKGIQVWSGARGRRGFSKEAFQAYFDGYLSVAGELNGPLHLAPVFLFGQKRVEPSMKITAGPTSLRWSIRGTNSYPSVAWFCAAHRWGGLPVLSEFSGGNGNGRIQRLAGRQSRRSFCRRNRANAQRLVLRDASAVGSQSVPVWQGSRAYYQQ